ncbi:hypothetical protein B0J12DRAFT_782770 [Macrophomina phaseolina]|uniref:Uncharacterized protein n=1 Tax=Macrophomina phaseolina TaxID=35725 RepID=A0ABQ8GM46_9PEZI|nr:hypothetical protein B0J12DRAFT_782770 [Macrophomina phaseolina]
MNLLATDISNQRRPESVVEDKGNKAWRPLPSGRITAEGARQLMLIAIPAAIAKSLIIGGAHGDACTIPAPYNDLGGNASRHLTRNLLNALGISSFCANAIAPSSPL